MMSKVQGDVLKGKANRALFEDVMNSAFRRYGSSLFFKPLHPGVGPLPTSKMKRVSNTVNFTQPVENDRAVGLYYLLCKKNEQNFVPFLLIPNNSPNVYVKIPRYQMQGPDPISYIKYLVSLNYHLAIFVPGERVARMSFPYAPETLLRGELCNSKGNRNRYIVYGVTPRDVEIRPLVGKVSVLDTERRTLLQALEDLFLGANS